MDFLRLFKELLTFIGYLPNSIEQMSYLTSKKIIKSYISTNVIVLFISRTIKILLSKYY